MQIAGTSAIVTGGASGLGGATARALAKNGAKVFALDLPSSIEKADEVDGVTYVGTDVTVPDQVRAAVEQAVSSGGAAAPLRTASNCAAIGAPARILRPERLLRGHP